MIGILKYTCVYDITKSSLAILSNFLFPHSNHIRFLRHISQTCYCCCSCGMVRAFVFFIHSVIHSVIHSFELNNTVFLCVLICTTRHLDELTAKEDNVVGIFISHMNLHALLSLSFICHSPLTTWAQLTAAQIPLKENLKFFACEFQKKKKKKNKKRIKAVAKP